LLVAVGLGSAKVQWNDVVNLNGSTQNAEFKAIAA